VMSSLPSTICLSGIWGTSDGRTIARYSSTVRGLISADYFVGSAGQ
jgi:hypothetical protein